ncbi:hypothetical protein ACFL52_00660 [Candidatus Margulisiibacteriota bacterium]
MSIHRIYRSPRCRDTRELVAPRHMEARLTRDDLFKSSGLVAARDDNDLSGGIANTNPLTLLLRVKNRHLLINDILVYSGDESFCNVTNMVLQELKERHNFGYKFKVVNDSISALDYLKKPTGDRPDLIICGDDELGSISYCLGPPTQRPCIICCVDDLMNVSSQKSNELQNEGVVLPINQDHLPLYIVNAFRQQYHAGPENSATQTLDNPGFDVTVDTPINGKPESLVDMRTGKFRNILVISRDIPLIESIRSNLRSTRPRIQSTQNNRIPLIDQAAAALFLDEPDLVLVDLQNPDAIDIIEKLRSIENLFIKSQRKFWLGGISKTGLSQEAKVNLSQLSDSINFIYEEPRFGSDLFRTLTESDSLFKRSTSKELAAIGTNQVLISESYHKPERPEKVRNILMVTNIYDQHSISHIKNIFNKLKKEFVINSLFNVDSQIILGKEQKMIELSTTGQSDSAVNIYTVYLKQFKDFALARIHRYITAYVRGLEIDMIFMQDKTFAELLRKKENYRGYIIDTSNEVQNADFDCAITSNPALFLKVLFIA